MNITCVYYTQHFPLQTLAKLTSADITCSENVAYDTVGNTVKTSTQAKVTCTENTAYATLSNETQDTNTSTSHNAGYDELQLTKL